MKSPLQEPEHVRRLRCEEILQKHHDDKTVALTFRTSDGNLIGLFHPAAEEQDAGAAVWVGGAGGGLDGPARGLYPAACIELQKHNIAGLRLHYRYPNHLEDCVLDTLLGVEFLASRGYKAVALVGHSFGGAVVITAGAMSPHVKAVVPMSTQTYGVDLAPELSPRALLLIHGTEDEILPDRCSKHVYEIAREPKELRLFDRTRHGLDESREEILTLLVSWIANQLRVAETKRPPG